METSLTQKSVEQVRPSHDRQGPVAVQGVLSYPSALLAHPNLAGRGNGPVRTSLLLSMQQTYGNRAVQRFIKNRGSISVQRCGSTPCNCSPQRRAAHTWAHPEEASVQRQQSNKSSYGSVRCPSPEEFGMVPEDQHLASGSKCRGACGSDCPGTCKLGSEVHNIKDTTGKSIAKCKYEYRECGSHPACRWHDLCYDTCAATKKEKELCTGGGTCHCKCDTVVLNQYGAAAAYSWMNGGGPYDKYIKFYTQPGKLVSATSKVSSMKNTGGASKIKEK